MLILIINKMKNVIFKLSIVLSLFLLSACSGEENFVDKTINQDSQVPFVMVQDQNEVFNGNPITWNRRMRGENGRTQIRAKFFCSDPNVTTHEIVVGRTVAGNQMIFDDPTHPNFPKSLLTLNNNFPTEDIVITKAQVAQALGIDESALPTRVFFSGISRNSKGKVINGRTRFETFTGGTEVRHAYIYEWRFADGN